jgi:hypothetical protein
LVEEGYVGEFANTFGVNYFHPCANPRVKNPGLKLANAFGVMRSAFSQKLILFH